jgi:predicted DNA-binding transcriptional regulator YafY
VRAARVLDMLLILQRRGRLTAGELGAALEVSQRTVLRDVEALSETGVPIYATRGAGGGIELMDGFQTRLTGLTQEEAECLFLVGQPQVAHRLGLGATVRSARAKLSSGLPPALAEQTACQAGSCTTPTHGAASGCRTGSCAGSLAASAEAGGWSCI